MTLKILIPNATAGMIIGKGGEHIRAIKEKTGAFVQLSRKNELPERCITVSGEYGTLIRPRGWLEEPFQTLLCYRNEGRNLESRRRVSWNDR